MNVKDTPNESTRNDFYLRRSLDGQEKIGLTFFESCPDVIQSDRHVSEPQQEFGTRKSWDRSYSVAPDFEVVNYYYVRAMRAMSGPADEVAGFLSLYWAPAQVFMLPDRWSSNRLKTADGSASAKISAHAGEVGVGKSAFMWSPADNELPHESYVSFVGHCHAEESPVLPSVRDWRELATLIGRNRSFGIRNQAVVWGRHWVKRQQLEVPASFAQAPITVNVSARGLAETEVCLLLDAVDDKHDDQVAILDRCRLSGEEGSCVSTTFTPVPGHRTNLTVKFWNPKSVSIEPGSTLQVTFEFPVSDDLAGVLDQGSVNQYAPVEGPRGAVKLERRCRVGELCFTFAPAPDRGIR